MIDVKRVVSRLCNYEGYQGYYLNAKLQTKYPWHYFGCRYAWQHFPWFIRHLIICFMTVSWPFRCLYQSIKYWRRINKFIEKQSQYTAIRLLFKQFSFSLCSGIPPIVFYRFGFYIDNHGRDVAAYLYNHELKGLFLKLNNFNKDLAIDNKYEFFVRCQQHKLPTVPILFYYKNGAKQSMALNTQIDLFSKPVYNCQGKGAEFWKYIGGGKYKNNHGLCFSTQQLDRYFKTRSKSEDLIVQPYIKNHPDLARLFSNQVVTGRLITAKVDQHYEYLTGLIKLPLANRITNNSGLSYPVNSETGRLGPGRLYRPGRKTFTHYPKTQALIEGSKIPNWCLAKQLVCDAHQLFPDFIFLGWDVVFSDHGVMLLEVNQFWEAEMIQLVHNEPLGSTQFSDIVIKQLML